MVLSPATSPLEISVAYVLHLATLAESFGVPRDTLLRTLPEAALVPGPAPAVIRAEQLEETLARAFATTQEPSLGFLLGLAMQPSWHGMAGLAVMSAPSVEASLEFALRAHPLVLRGLAVAVSRDAEQLRVVVDLDRAMTVGRPFVLATALVGCAAMTSALTGSEFPGTLDFDFPRPSTLKGYADAFPFAMTFDADECAITIPVDFLALPMRTSDPYALEQAREQCERQLREIETRAPLTRRVRELVLDQDALRTQAEVARLLSQSPRTLSRGLAAEGTSFSEVADGLRHALATELLAHTDLTIDEVAGRVGYSDTANFGRAFRRWQAVSPGAFRKTSRER
ncbi:MAG: AraC family transcriptional regulator ligand-binding domain-containing protein [Myxococcales bacterium]|nr:AraC family transcriptional regulator ligand-binding domain-containing protein [Myxococcales bacterium]